MWCVNCNCAFCWNTGRVYENLTTVHNPHYIEYLRTRGREGQLAEPCGEDLVDIVHMELALLGDMWTYGIVDEFWRNDTSGPLAYIPSSMACASELIAYLRRVYIPYTEHMRASLADNLDLGIKFLEGRIDRKKWGATLEQRAKRSEKLRRMVRKMFHLTQKYVDLYSLVRFDLVCISHHNLLVCECYFTIIFVFVFTCREHWNHIL